MKQTGQPFFTIFEALLNPGDRYLLYYSFSFICLKFLFHSKIRS